MTKTNMAGITMPVCFYIRVIFTKMCGHISTIRFALTVRVLAQSRSVLIFSPISTESSRVCAISCTISSSNKRALYAWAKYRAKTTICLILVPENPSRLHFCRRPRTLYYSACQAIQIQSLKLLNCRGMSIFASFSMAITDCRSSRFLPVTRTLSP